MRAAKKPRIGSRGEKSDRKGIKEADSTELAADRVDGDGGKVG